MPTYEYKCSACGHTFERFQSMSADPIKRCPQCGKAKVKRLIGTGAGLIFKGSGFYITDYRDAGYKESAKADSGGGSGGDSKGETKTDGKTETKSGGEAASGSAPATSGPESKPSTPKSDTRSTSRNEGKSSKKKQ